MSVEEIASAQTPVSFKYVFIPCDDAEPVTEVVMKTTKGEVLGCLLDALRAHYIKRGKITSVARRQELKDEMVKQMKKQGQTSDGSDQMMDLMADSQTVDIVPLIPALKPGGYISVTLYVDDKGSAKELPMNNRATALAAACGVASTDVLGDAFVARAYDNESEDMERHDFTRMDLEPDAAWFREAARLKHVLVQTRVGVTQDDAVVVADQDAKLLMEHAEADGLPFIPPIEHPMPMQERVAAAESIRSKGNALFKEGKVAGALSAYEKTLRYLDCHPAPSAGPAVTCRVAALGNAAMCRLKLDQPKRAIEACDKVLAIEKKNAKALFRKGSALRALGEFETAVEALQAASEIAPGDAGIKAELAKADKDLKKFRYGW